MAIAEKNIVITSKDELNQTVIYKPYTSVDMVEGAISSLNGITPDDNGNVNISRIDNANNAKSADSVEWNNVKNKPKSFTPIAHNHNTNEITGLAGVATSGSYNDLTDKPTNVSSFSNDAGYLTQHQSLEGYVKTSGQNTWRAQQTFNLATLGYEQYTTPNRSTASVTPAKSTATYYATGAFTLNLATLSALLGSNQSTVFTAYITAGSNYALSITNGGTIKYIGDASDVAITNSGMMLNIFMTKNASGALTSIVQASKLA
ncbi:hypothetical protein [Phascolarctobacterium succinatutens]|jgi:hypothetical protein|uniref:hypothetical protein n=1 Tax=Phascolarctobacterium succinatutens TaxID=626940 RepID=UPI00307F5501